MYYEGIQGRQHKLICSDCGEGFDFRIEIRKHQEPGLKQCTRRSWSRSYTAFSGK